MTPEDQAALDAITRLYSGGARRIAPAALVQHDPFTGHACVRIDSIMASGMQAQGYDPATYAQDYAESLKRAGLWPADLPAMIRRRVRRWSRRGWRVVIGR